MKNILSALLILSATTLLFINNVNAQCAGFGIDSVQVTDPACQGAANGSITVFASGGTGPYTYSSGGSGAPIQGAQGFNSASDLSTQFGSGPTNKWWSPSSCTDGVYFQYNASEGCPPGSAYFAGSFGGFQGCFLRSPQVDLSAYTEVTVTFDLSHSSSSGRPNDKIDFSVWVGGGYQNQTTVPMTVNGTATRDLFFDQPRSCETVTVTLDLSAVADRTDFLFYINTRCQYNSCSTYSATIDNIGIEEAGSFQTSNTFTNLAPGTYTIEVMDDNGCVVDTPITLTDPQQLSPGLSVTNVTSVGGTDGTATTTANGGTPPYSFSWDTGDTSGTITNLSAGTYCATITDANGCQTAGCASVSDPNCSSLAINNVVADDVSCNGDTDGSITINASGGNFFLQYSIDSVNFQSGNGFSGLAPGTYKAVVRDSVGCVLSYPGGVTIQEPDILQLSTSVTDPSSQGANDGAVDLTVSGGTSSYNYNWDNGDITEDINGLAPGSYCVTVTDNNGCTASACATVNQGGCQAPIIDSIVSTDISCHGVSDGDITIYASGGAAPLQYSVNGGSSFQLSNSFSGLPAGSYTIVVEGNDGCTVQGQQPVTITEPDPLALSMAITNATHPDSLNGAIDLSVTGGISSYTYQWNSGQTTEDLTMLENGPYCVTVTDANGCTAALCDTVQVDGPVDPCPNFTLNSVTTTPVSCPDADDGVITIISTGGVSPVLYSIDNGANFQTNNTFNNLTPGSYNVLMQDFSGCVKVYGNNPVVLDSCPLSATGVELISALQLYPNPVDVSLSLQLQLKHSTDVTVTLYNLMGEQLWQRSFMSTERVQEDIDVQHMADGIYLLKIETAEGSLVRKVVKG